MSEIPDARYPACGLPRSLGDGLVARWATPGDVEAVVSFNQRIHRAGADDPAEDVAYATRDLIGGGHPTTNAADFTVVVDEGAGGRVVSTMLLLSQTWAYDGLPFALGRPEWVGTDPAYRRRGLVRLQLDAIHARSAARGELVQGITGIPWYYRRFGYALALDRGGSRLLPWHRLDVPAPDAEWRLRRATVDDIPLLSQLYAIHCAHGLVTRLRDAAEWRWELAGTHHTSMYHRTFEIVESPPGRPAGYVQTQVHGRSGAIAVHELAAAPGVSLHALCAFLAHAFQARTVDAARRAARPLPPGLILALGAAHPAYVALEPLLDPLQPPSAWYIRVADVAAFLRHVRPVLERRLRGSVMEGHDGSLRLSFYRHGVHLQFARGTLVEVRPYAPAHPGDGDACFPDLTFLHLLFGHRGLADLRHAFADCLVDSSTAEVLLQVLFPPRASQPVMLG